jgi:hypothetical protein
MRHSGAFDGDADKAFSDRIKSNRPRESISRPIINIT